MKKSLIALAIACTAGAAYGQGSIFDGNAEANWSSSSGVMTGLFPNGANNFDQVFEYAWGARVNGVPESFLVASTQAYAGNTATFTATLGGLDFTYRFVLTDGTGNDAIVNTHLSVTNNTPTFATLSVFSYSDLDLNNTISDDEAFYDPINNAVDQFDALAGFEMTHFGFDADRWEIDRYALLRTRLNDGVVYNLTSTDLTAPGPLDHTAAFQWSDRTIGPGQTFTYESALNIPTPAGIALLGLGGLFAARRRRA